MSATEGKTLQQLLIERADREKHAQGEPVESECRKCGTKHTVYANEPYASPEWVCSVCGTENSAV